jgi:hypothetical protein
VQRAGVLLRSLKPSFIAKSNVQQILDAIQQEDQTISRSEALKAYHRNLAALQRAAASAGK